MSRKLRSMFLPTVAVLMLAASHPLPDIHDPVPSGVLAPYDSAVILGFEHYDSLPRVPYAQRDAHAVYQFLVETRGISPYRVKVLNYGDKDRVMAALATAAAGTGSDGIVWFYFAGHGATYPGTGEPVMLDISATTEDESIVSHGIRVSEVVRAAQSRGTRAMLLLDTGFDGSGRTGESIRPDSPFEALQLPEAEEESLIWMATEAGGPVNLQFDTRHGAFTYLALGALRGWADGALDGARDGSVTAAEAQDYVTRAFSAVGMPGQHPVLHGKNAEMPLTGGKLEKGPDLDMLAEAVREGTISTAVDLTPEQRLEAWTNHEQVEHELSTSAAKMWWRAKRDWRRTQEKALVGGPDAIAALTHYIERYEGATITAGDVTREVLVPEVAACRAWLEELEPQKERPPANYRFLQVDAGGFHTCGVTVDGEAVCWGDNRRGQSDSPEGTFTQINAGGYHTCAMDLDGNVTCWGRSGGFDYSPAGQFSQVSAGGYHTCGTLLQSSTVQCWGEEQSGRRRAPSGKFSTVSSGLYHTCGVRDNGTLKCWGKIEDVPGGDGYVDVSCGSLNACGLKSYGVLICWGGDPHGSSHPPWGEYVEVSVGAGHACAITLDQEIVCWGDNKQGQATAPEGKFVSVTCGTSHSCGVREDGSVVCWGDDVYGQCTPP